MIKSIIIIKVLLLKVLDFKSSKILHKQFSRGFNDRGSIGNGENFAKIPPNSKILCKTMAVHQGIWNLETV